MKKAPLVSGAFVRCLMGFWGGQATNGNYSAVLVRIIAVYLVAPSGEKPEEEELPALRNCLKMFSAIARRRCGDAASFS
ncbi:hypothetical protein [Aquisalinus flavus]|uniref:hypothetical protein n=1 Tax=Aquisalinus flavus TaxID=1526572 RepID=UPI00165F6D69|nr:hypothetical protein [Aquisalinus flavus]MBD0427707.1 hypothetical protein [Aquisalinus flavus]UNE47485.1 hypothetical protein FF099_05140 [Aquisalinus flavus]